MTLTRSRTLSDRGKLDREEGRFFKGRYICRSINVIYTRSAGRQKELRRSGVTTGPSSKKQKKRGGGGREGSIRGIYYEGENQVPATKDSPRKDL